MDEYPWIMSDYDSDGGLFFPEETSGSPDPPVAEAPSHCEKAPPRVCVHPFRTLQSADPAVRLLNAYYTIYPYAGQ